MNPSAPARASAALAAAVALAAFAVPAAAQEGVPPPPGLVPEQMWPAPTAADWQKPVQIRWQRTWDDAVALSRQTKKPILVCINMDGEIASEHYAGIRYRDPEIGKLYEPYACVIASVYRHNERDYDEQGRRIECPRLGCVTCGEHISIEPLLYEKFMDGKRISPRHIMVELDGKETYDVFYTWDLDSVWKALGDGIKNRAISALPVVKGDRSILERVQSVDSEDRQAVEEAFARGDAATKQSLLAAALGLGADAPVELLRQAVFGLDVGQARQARRGLAAAKGEGAVDLIATTLRAPLPPDEQQQLVDALQRLGETSPKAKMLATVHRGLDGKQASIDVGRWAAALGGASYAAAAADPADRFDASAVAAEQQPADAQSQLVLAEATLEQALAATRTQVGPGRPTDRYARLLFEDARRSAKRAEELGLVDWRTHAVLALCELHLGQRRQAYAHAERAAKDLPPDAPGRIAAEVMALFAAARQEAIIAAVRSKADWTPSWMSDVHAAYSVLRKHPFGTDAHVADHWDFLNFFDAAQAATVLDEGLRRFPESPRLHECLRRHVLATRTPDALEAEYAARLRANATPNLHWFAGYAAMVAAEAHRKARAPEQALAAYDRAMEHFAASCRDVEANTASANHFIAMALGGQARIKLQQDDLDGALALLEASFGKHPDAASAVDGLQITTVQTAEMLRPKLVAGGRDELVQRLDAALGRLTPEQREPPEYERASRPQRRR